jgi:RND family efflux transporter MFP subunit
MSKPIAWIAAIAVAAAAAGGGYWLGQRTPAAHKQASAAAPGSGSEQRKVLYYRNPMGLPDTSPVPKKDPMGMDYVPVYAGEEPERLPPGTVKISTDKVQMLGVRTEGVQERILSRAIRAVGTVQPNERGLHTIAPKFEGYIEKLHVNTTGQAVARGQILMEVYSPELVSAQEEYLIALRGARDLKDAEAGAQATMQRLAEAALRRLRNWDISERELDELRANGKPQRLIAYRSPASGVVLDKPSVQGMRFMPGDALYQIADLTAVWLIAEVAEQDVGLVRNGQQAKARFTSYPGREFEGRVVFLYPTLDASTRRGSVRIEMANRQLLLKPSMYGEVELASPSGGKVLAVPSSAVLDSGTRQVVLVQRGEGLFESRAVKLGASADGYVEVKDGLRAGEQVVVRANFLIDAESNLKAALDSFGSSGARHNGSGKVVSVNASAGTVEIDHAPMPSLQWPAMRMEFQARDRAALARLKPGDAVQFELSQPKPGEFVIERIGGGAGHGGHK